MNSTIFSCMSDYNFSTQDSCYYIYRDAHYKKKKELKFILWQMLDKALKSFSQAKEINNKDPKTYFYLGHLFLEKGKYDLAVENLLSSLAYDSIQPIAHYNLDIAEGLQKRS
ncbi:MAG: hypothetical protein ABIA04_16400 [Pseudomonadota bacterium]